MAEENKEINWQFVAIGNILLVLSILTVIVMQTEFLRQIPMGPMVASLTSTTSMCVALVLLYNAFNLTLLEDLKLEDLKIA